MYEKHMGECIGGPLDKKWLVHWSKTYKLLSPMIGLTFSMSEDAPIIPVEIGEYRLNDYGHWHWWETEAGKAMSVLQKEASHA